MSKSTAAIVIKEAHHIRCGNAKCRSVILPGQKIWTVTVLDEKGVLSTHVCCCSKCAALMKQKSVAHYEKIAAALKASPIVATKLERPFIRK